MAAVVLTNISVIALVFPGVSLAVPPVIFPDVPDIAGAA